MSKSVKLALGIATLWPLVFMFLFFGFMYYLLLGGMGRPESGGGMRSGMIAIIVLHGITMLWDLVLLIIFIYNVFNNDRVDKDKKTLWAVVLFLGSIISMPIYWYLYIWPEKKFAGSARRSLTRCQPTMPTI
jgi:hypothetical protein